MKKILALTLLLAGLARAQNTSTPVALVQEIYRAARAGDAVLAILRRHGDAQLQRALDINDRVSDEGFVCLDYDPLWDSQEPQIGAKVQVKPLKKGWVRASFLQYKKRVQVDFLVHCSGGICQLGDIKNGGQSVKALLQACANPPPPEPVR